MQPKHQKIKPSKQYSINQLVAKKVAFLDYESLSFITHQTTGVFHSLTYYVLSQYKNKLKLQPDQNVIYLNCKKDHFLYCVFLKIIANKNPYRIKNIIINNYFIKTTGLQKNYFTDNNLIISHQTKTTLDKIFLIYFANC